MGYSGLEGLPPEQREALLDKVVMEVKVHFPEGHQPQVMIRTWTWRDANKGLLPDVGDPADHDFLTNPRRSWPHPQSPVTIEADAVPGREYDAREWVDLL